MEPDFGIYIQKYGFCNGCPNANLRIDEADLMMPTICIHQLACERIRDVILGHVTLASEKEANKCTE